MKTKSLFSKPLLLLVIFFLLFNNGFSQDTEGLKEYENRYEGAISEPISGLPHLTVISFTGYFEDYESNKDQQLKIRFFMEEESPDENPVEIQVRQTIGNALYRMKPKEFSLLKGWNEFSPWPVDDVLSPWGLKKEDLGITIRKNSDKKVLIPAFAYHSENNRTLEQYKFQFLPGTTLWKVKFKLYKGFYKEKALDESKVVFKHDFRKKKKYGGERFFLNIDLLDTALAADWEGWLTLVMEGREYETYNKVNAYYFFYHQPQLK